MTLSLAVMTIVGMVKSFSGEILQSLSWWWIFLSIGLFFLFLTFVKDEKDFWDSEYGKLSHFYEKIIGITGTIMLVLLTIFVIFIAEKNASKSVKMWTIGNIFSSWAVYLSGGQITSPAFMEIKNFSLNRSKNFLSFLTIDNNGKMMAYPSETEIKNPENLAFVHRFDDRDLFVQKDGSVIESGKWIGHTNMVGEISDFIVFRSEDGTLHLVSDFWTQTFRSETDNPELFTYNSKTKDLYWRERIGGNHRIFKNGKAISEPYPNILRYAISDDGNLLMITENADYSKFVIKNNTAIHQIRDEYIQGTLRMNNSDVMYVIKNTDDNSFSVVLNGVILDRKLDEIREIFIEQNTSGFAYFGRPQWEAKYCLFTRYRGNLCSIESYMNPELEGDNSAIAFAALREWRWSIYRNTREIIRNSGYKNRNDISFDYFFFDRTNLRHYVFIEKLPNGYVINKMWKIIDGVWEDIDVENIHFGYEKMFAPVKDASGWKILEF